MHHNRKDKWASSFLSLYAFKPIVIFYITRAALPTSEVEFEYAISLDSKIM